MIVYEPSDCIISQNEFHRFALEAARKLLPDAKFLLSKLNMQNVTLPLLHASNLAIFELHKGKLEAGDWNAILKNAGEFRARNEKLIKFPIGETHFFIVGQDFSPNFLKETSASELRIRLFTWSLIRSKDHQALLLQKFEQNVNSSLFDEETNRDASQGEEDSSHNSFTLGELSTAELIELTRLGISIRARVW